MVYSSSSAGSKRSDLLLDPFRDGLDVGLEVLGVREHRLQKERVMIFEAAGQSVAQCGQLGT